MLRSTRSVRLEAWGRPGGRLILRDALLRNAPQRLCCRSSALPFSVVSEHGVEDGKKLPRHGDEGDLLRLTGGKQALVEDLEKRVVTADRQGGNEQSRTQGGPAATNHGLAPPAPRLSGVRRDASQACDAPAIKAAELWRLREADAGERILD